MEDSKYKMIDLFAGAGGLTLGFVKENFIIKKTVEFWQPAVETYNFNFKTNVKPQDITNSLVRDEIENNFKNKIDLIIGGFPCQGYSMAGKRDPNDPRNQLYLYTIDVIKRTQPKFFVLENVKGLLSFKENDGVLTVQKIINLLDSIGYYSNYKLVDSSFFGVPQKRERVIFIGALKKDKEKVEECIEKISRHKEPIKTVRNAIEDLEKINNLEISNHNITKHSEEMLEKIKNTKTGESALKKFADAFKRISYDKPSPTVKENHGGVHLHPKLNRVLTPRELAMLQTFPDDFIFKSSKSNVLKQIGNAVPVKLANEIAKIVKEVFYGE